MFSCEYCEILQNTYFEVHLNTAAFVSLELKTYFHEILWGIACFEVYSLLLTYLSKMYCRLLIYPNIALYVNITDLYHRKFDSVGRTYVYC